jgi:hypothetical protein
VKDFTAARNVSFNVSDVIKIAEEEYSSVSKEGWAARCMHGKKIEEEYVKLEPAIYETSERFIVNLETTLITAPVTSSQPAWRNEQSRSSG